MLVIAGLATAAAALTRVEILVLVAAFGSTLVVLQFQCKTRRPSAELVLAGVAFLAGFVAVFGPFLIVAEDRTPAAAVARLLGRAEVVSVREDIEKSRAGEEDGSLLPHRMDALSDNSSGLRKIGGDVGLDEGDSRPRWRLPDGQPMAFDAKEPTQSIRHRGYPAAAWRFVRKLTGAFGFWIGGLALWGAWLLRRQARSPAARLIQVFYVVFSLVVIHFAAAEGYLDCRHLLPLVVAGIAAAGYGAVELARRMARQRAPLTAGIVLLIGLACLPRTFRSLHDSHRGHREAGDWLAAQDTPGAVLDTVGWAGLYSGRTAYTYDRAPAALDDRQLAYLVVQPAELTFDSGRAQTLRWLIAAAGRPVAEFPEASTRSPRQQPVAVYRFDYRRLRQAALADQLSQHQFTAAKPSP